MSAVDVARIVAISLVAAVVVGAVALPLLRLTRRASVVAQLVVLIIAAVAAMAAGTIAVGLAMYVSPHDLVVTLVVAAVSGVIAVALAWLLGRTFVRSTERLRLVAKALGDGDPLEIDRDVHHNIEFATVTAELSATSRRLAEARDEVVAIEASRRDLIAWISHDLRTPLAGLRAMAESLEDGVAEDPPRYYARMRAQVDHLSVMVDDLFELSKIQTGTMPLTMEHIALYDLVSDAVAELAPLALARSIRMTEDCGDSLVVVGDPGELARMVGNLLINAIQHSAEGGTILVAARHDGDDRVLLTVEDSAGGIPEPDLERVFEPGWRGTAARTIDPSTRAAGAGLGLAIVRGIAEAHAGNVSVQNVPGGCRFNVRLPRQQHLTA
ncbi:sensor histidine kinase [uncultured Amnibacterium sp.]|uniref:sensor histidine kinase n=1 Tax=uncultured Amnibacterium sp. TaxID=1631851 RepID=UPI0035CC6097